MQTKKCSKCRIEKPVERYVRDKRRRDGLYPVCKDCRGSYYQANREWILPQYKEYRGIHSDRLLADHRAYAYRRFFYKRAANLVTRNGVKRPSQPLGLSDMCSALSRQWKRQRGVCPLTGRRLTRDTAQIDHILAIKNGGSDDPANLRWVHRDVNYAKRDLTDEQFYGLCLDVINHKAATQGVLNPKNVDGEHPPQYQ